MDRLFWITRPFEEKNFSLPMAHLAYRIENSHLLRGPLSDQTRGGIMAFDRINGCESISAVAGDILSECTFFSYQAVLFYPSTPLDPSQLTDCDILAQILNNRKIPFILPLVYAPYCPNARYLVSTAISGGSLNVYLKELIQEYGIQNLALEHPRTAMEFTMPSLTNTGNPLSEAELAEIQSGANFQPYYSPDLYLNYYTYQRDGVAYFLLFDDCRSLKAKILLGDEFGFPLQFLTYHETKDFSLDFLTNWGIGIIMFLG